MAQAIQVKDPLVLWVARSKPQQMLTSCPFDEIFFGGARGGGKTEGCLGEWILHSEAYREDASGVFFRHTLPQLEQVIERAKVLFKPMGYNYNGQAKTFHFDNGSTLKFRYLNGKADADNYQGHQYTRVYFEEMTNWADPDPIDMLRATLRSPADVQCKLIGTGNPGGVGHTWVKERYIDPDRNGYYPVTERFEYEGQTVEMTRVFIPSTLDDNEALQNKAQYIAQLYQVGSPELVRAWLQGDWDIAAGAFFEGVWVPEQHIIEPFAIPPHWKRWRAMDWGFRAPYSIGWYAIDEEDCIYRYRELYGYGGKANRGTEEEASAVAAAILKVEEAERKVGITFMNNPADSSIWNSDGRFHSIADIFFDSGVQWEKAVKGPASRVNGLQEVVNRLRADKFKVFSTCKHFLRTVPVVPRDEKNPDDVDTDAEDHVIDEVRYSLSTRVLKSREKKAEETKAKTHSFDWLVEKTRRDSKRAPKYGLRQGIDGYGKRN
jgi:hypothetical protein